MTSQTHIAVLDDEVDIRQLLATYLQAHGFRVSQWHSGQALMQAMGDDPPALVLLDLGLPGEDGFGIARQLREHWHCGLVIVTGRGDAVDKVVGLEVGADDYVTKPFGPRELIARLQAALRRAAPEAAEPTIVADGLEIDLAGHTVRRDGEPVHLTPTEFGLLAELARNRGRLLTHRALLVAVWGVEYEDDTQVLRAHVANLRRKIEPPDGPRYVLTDPGVGYRFAA